jgi:hypothetical protein
MSRSDCMGNTLCEKTKIVFGLKNLRKDSKERDWLIGDMIA